MPNTICQYPFDCCRINIDGNVSFCCWLLDKRLSLGNINTEPFEKIWNSPAARSIRQDVLAGNYAQCSRETCLFLTRPARPDDNEFAPYPQIVEFNLSRECNLSCVICRTAHTQYLDCEFEKFQEKIDKIYIPLLKNTRQIYLSGSDEPFVSRHCRLLIQRILQTYPNIRFGFSTNGTLCSRKMLEDYGVCDKIDYLQISLHSATREMWLRFTRGSTEQYARLMQNIGEMVELKKSGKLGKLELNFVLTSVNYTELADFVRFAEKLSALVLIWGVRHADNIAVHFPTHQDYGKLKEILKDPVFDLPCVFLLPEIKKVRREALEDARNVQDNL